MPATGPLLEGHSANNSSLKKLPPDRFSLFRRFWLPLGIAGLVFLAAWLVGFLRGPFVIDVGGDNRLDALYLQTSEGGFFVPEKQQSETFAPDYDSTYRWTGRISYISLPWPLDAVPLKVTLRATAPRPDRSPDKPGTTLSVSGLIGNNTTELGKYELNGLYEGSELVFRLPEHLRPNLEHFRLRFESSETWQPGQGDIRNLSAIFFNLKLEPDYAAFGWRGWLASLARPFLLALITFTMWGLAGLFTERRGRGVLVEAIGGLVLVASIVGWPQMAEPFYAPWLCLFGAGWGLLWLAGRFATNAPSLPAPFVYAATLLPLLPLAQLIFGRLELANINPGSVSIVAYFGALLVSGLGYTMLRRRFEMIFTLAFVAAAVLVFSYTHWQVYEQNLSRGADFRNYYIGLLDVEQFGQPLYNLADMAQFPGRAIRQPPAFALFFWPLARFFGRDVNAALLGWRVANELLLVPTLLILLHVFGRLKPGLKMWPAIVFLVMSFGQLAETTAYGQQNYILLFGLALTALWVKQKRDGLAGVALSVSIWSKLLPALTGAFFLVERRWRGLVGLVVGAGLMNGLTVAAVGWDNVWFYFSKAMWSVNEPELGITNQSFWGFMGRLAVNEVKGDFLGGYPTRLAPLGYLVALLGLGATLLVMWRRRGGDWLSQQLALGALALLGLWIPPFSWMHYIVPGLVAIVAMTAALSRDNKVAPRGALIIFGLAYALLAYGGRQDFFFVEAVGLAQLGSSYRFMATFAFWALSLWLLWRSAPRSEITPT